MRSRARFLISRSAAIKQYDKVKSLCDEVSYSYKTNYDIGKILEKKTDSSISVHSIESLSRLDTPSRAWFFAQAWDKTELEEIFKIGARRFVVDNESDLSTLRDWLTDSKEKISLLLRMRLKENTIHTGKHFVYGLFSSRVNELIPELRNNDKIKELGIHFHRKTQNISEWSLKEELSESIEEKNWDKIDVVNIGGGLPAIYKNYRIGVLKPIIKQITLLRTWLSKKNIRMIIEPGRFIAASPVKLETHIVSIYGDNIIIDSSVFNSAMDTFVAHIRLMVEGELEKGDAYTIKGCTPDSMDIFRYRVYLRSPKIGDKMTFLNAGAYTYASDFCNLPKPIVKIID